MAKLNEIWKIIPEFPRYKASNLGRIMGCEHRGKKAVILKPYLASNGYFYVAFRLNGKSYTKYVHPFVLSSFKGIRKSKQICRHLDGIKTNNNVSNLEWGTSKENMADSIKHRTMQRGSRHYMSRLSEYDVLDIRRRFFRTSPKKSNSTELSVEYKICKDTLYHIIRRETWTHI